jgi:hypothetical protein
VDHDSIKAAVTEAIQEQMRDFYVDREKHYQHHEFLESLIRWRDSCKSTCMKAVANMLIASILGLLVLGFLAWGGKALK